MYRCSVVLLQLVAHNVIISLVSFFSSAQLYVGEANFLVFLWRALPVLPRLLPAARWIAAFAICGLHNYVVANLSWYTSTILKLMSIKCTVRPSFSRHASRQRLRSYYFLSVSLPLSLLDHSSCLASLRLVFSPLSMSVSVWRCPPPLCETSLHHSFQITVSSVFCRAHKITAKEGA